MPYFWNRFWLGAKYWNCTRAGILIFILLDLVLDSDVIILFTFLS
jgi:hypothetical protein